MGDVYEKIAERFANFHPPVKLDEHIEPGSLKEGSDTLIGIKFVPKDRQALFRCFENAKDISGDNVFTRSRINNREHWALLLSFGASEGIGFRQVWRFPPLFDKGWDRPMLADRYTQRSTDAFSAQFGDSLALPNLSSLHVAFDSPLCGIHIDDVGFVIEAADGSISLTSDLARHFVDDLLFKTYFRELIPKRARPAFDRISLNYPSLGNDGFAGPRVSKLPLLREVRHVPLVGAVIGRAPLPNGVRVDVIRRSKLKLTISASLGPGGNRVGTVTFSGALDMESVARKMMKILAD